MRPTELLDSVNRNANKAGSAKEDNKVEYCPFCGKFLSRQMATLYDAKHRQIKWCEIAWCCRKEPLVIIEQRG